MMNKNLKFLEYNLDYIENCMSLRSPQKQSLKILDTLLNQIELKKNNDIYNILETVHDICPTCKDFERDFFSIAFALATGVGKTRLMGAFIAYLYTIKGIKNFFIVAPNITIYEKLKSEFGDINNPKYVFKGLSCFAGVQPNIIYGENYKSAAFICGNSDCNINVFNIDKFNKKVGEMKHLSEFLGTSYFKYLSELDDLVILMDESHHYRADKGMAALNELHPVLGLELTATPQIEKGNKTIKFKNVVYEYPLSQAIIDGYTKIPYAMTRHDIGDFHFGDEDLDKLMISDGLLNHEQVKIGLKNYANLHPEERKIKPFMMIVCQNTAHAEKVMKFITSDDFENGKYRNKTIIIHSNQKEIEKEENIKLLQDVERYENPVEIVIHVNILKEGWDVNNLYTIVPLRTAASKTLREQIIGRGLRLPFGHRVDDNYVDSLVIAAHDKFEEIIMQSNEPNSLLKAKNVIFADEIKNKNCITSTPKVFDSLQTRLEDVFDDIPTSPNFSQEEKNIFAKTTSKITNILSDIYSINGLGKIRQELDRENISKQIKQSQDLSEIISKRADFSEIYERFIIKEISKQEEIIKNNTMEIPIISVKEDGTSDYYFEEFELDLSNMNYVPVANDLIYQNLINNERLFYKAKGIDFLSLNPMRILAYHLKNKPEVGDNYDDLIFNLISSFLKHLANQYDDETIQHIVMFNKLDIGNKIYEQMKNHFYKRDKDIVEQVVGVTYDPLDNSYIIRDNNIKNVFVTIPDCDVPKYVFSGFKKSIHKLYKFDSEPERKFAIVCDNDNQVIKWLRPAPNQFKLFYKNNSRYEPDFVVETKESMYLVEIKGEDRIDDVDVIAKRNRAVRYCQVVNIWAEGNNKKKWKHLFIPANEVRLNSSFDALAKRFEWTNITQ